MRLAKLHIHDTINLVGYSMAYRITKQINKMPSNVSEHRQSSLFLHMSLSMISRIICIGMSPSVLIASLFGSGLMKYTVGNPRTCKTIFWFALTFQVCKVHMNSITN